MIDAGLLKRTIQFFYLVSLSLKVTRYFAASEIHSMLLCLSLHLAIRCHIVQDLNFVIPMTIRNGGNGGSKTKQSHTKSILNQCYVTAMKSVKTLSTS